MRRALLVAMLLSLVLPAGCTGTASLKRESAARSGQSVVVSSEPTIPAPASPPMRQVGGQLESGYSGTGVTMPLRLRLGSPVRLFRLKAHASGDRVQDLIDPTRVALLYQVLSERGLEAELTYEPWDPLSFENGGFGDFGGPVEASRGQAAQYRGYIAALPSVGASPVVGVLAIGSDYLVSVAWTPTASAGVFYPSGLVGALVPGAKSAPYVPTGVVYRDKELARRILSGLRK
jgi:hypothetical protein